MVASGMLLGFYTEPSIKELMKPPSPKLETLVSWRTAVEAVDEGRGMEAIETLRRLVREYPDHPLPHLYLSLALSGSPTHLVEDDAQSSFRKAMSLPGAESIAREWILRNRADARALQDFAQSRLDLIKRHDGTLNAAAGRHGKITEDPIDTKSKTLFYKSILTALELALLVDPDSETIPGKIAIVEEYFRNFESAYQRLTNLINSVRKRGDTVPRENLVSLISQRGRVVLRLSDQLRRSGDLTEGRRARDLLRESADELRKQEANALEIAIRAGDSGVSNGIDRERLNDIVYYCLWITMETSLELGEMEREGGNSARARLEFENNKKVLDKLEYFARERNITLPSRFADLRNRLINGLVAVRAEPKSSQVR
jgi:hypothetical protein